jgi:DNA repair protein RadD
MNQINLFPDQLDVVDRVRHSLRSHKSVLMQSATGSGKTVMAAYMIQSAVSKGNRAVFIVPRKELLRQTAETLKKFGIEFGYFAAGYVPNPFAKVQIASGPTLARRLDKAPKANVVFVDETHFGSAQLETVIRHYQAQGAWVIGLSATPWKMSGKGLGDWFDHMEQGPSIGELIEKKRLSRYRMFAPSAPDLSKVKITAGDYAKGQLNDVMENDRVLIGNAVSHYSKHAAGRLNVTFCTSLKHAGIVADAFNEQGIPAAMISGEMDQDERSRRIKAFARRELHVLTSVDLLTFGFDLASAAQMDVTIEAMSDMRPTKSLSLQLQKWGRVLRYKPDPALIFDHAGNSDPDRGHGLPDDDREWQLEGRQKKKREGSEPTIPVRQCPKCYMVHRPTPECPGCGYVYPIQSRMVEEVEGELAEITERREKKEARMKQGRAGTLEQLMAMGKSQGNAMHILRARQRKAG